MDRLAIYTANEDIFFNQGGMDIFAKVIFYGMVFVLFVLLLDKFNNRTINRNLILFSSILTIIFIIVFKMVDGFAWLGNVLSFLF